MNTTLQIVKNSSKKSKSTLLIPAFYQTHFRNKKGRWFSSYLKQLLNRRDLVKHIKKIPGTRKWKKMYQNSGQNLFSVSFYPENDTWARLSALANSRGVSRCFIFVELLKLDLDSKRKPLVNRQIFSGTIPKTNTKSRLVLKICLEPAKNTLTTILIL